MLPALLLLNTEDVISAPQHFLEGHARHCHRHRAHHLRDAAHQPCRPPRSAKRGRRRKTTHPRTGNSQHNTYSKTWIGRGRARERASSLFLGHLLLRGRVSPRRDKVIHFIIFPPGCGRTASPNETTSAALDSGRKVCYNGGAFLIGEKQMYREEDHPRDRDGRFTEKGASEGEKLREAVGIYSDDPGSGRRVYPRKGGTDKARLGAALSAARRDREGRPR